MKVCCGVTGLYDCAVHRFVTLHAWVHGVLSCHNGNCVKDAPQLALESICTMYWEPCILEQLRVTHPIQVSANAAYNTP